MRKNVIAISIRDWYWASSMGSIFLRRFTEKPDSTTTQRMLASGEYSWNSGMFIGQLASILTEFERQIQIFI